MCAVCETEISRSPRQIKAKHGIHYCSRACHYRGRSLGLTPRVVEKPYVLVAPPPTPEQIARRVASRRAGKGYVHSEESRARLREATTRAIAEGRIPTSSKLEDIVADILAVRQIGFRRQFGIRGPRGRFVGVVDFLLDDGRALEVNGTFWHSDPRAYPNGPMHEVQRRNAAAWSRKLTALESQAIPLLVVWEMDLRDDAAQAVEVALAAR